MAARARGVVAKGKGSLGAQDHEGRQGDGIPIGDEELWRPHCSKMSS